MILCEFVGRWFSKNRIEQWKLVHRHSDGLIDLCAFEWGSSYFWICGDHLCDDERGQDYHPFSECVADNKISAANPKFFDELSRYLMRNE